MQLNNLLSMFILTFTLDFGKIKLFIFFRKFHLSQIYINTIVIGLGPLQISSRAAGGGRGEAHTETAFYLFRLVYDWRLQPLPNDVINFFWSRFV